MKRRRFLATLTLSSLLLASCGGQAEPVDDPQRLVQQVSEQVLARLKAERAVLEQHPDRIYALIEEQVLPHFDFIRMSAWVLGKYWRRASKEQKLRFIRAFRTLLVRTYGVALLEYTDQKIRFLPLRDDPANGNVTVRSEVIQPGGERVAINYRLHRRNGIWKVYDISVDGVSLVANYRTSFASEIKQKGLDALIERLERHNKQAVHRHE
ncbi:MAG: MlaC/ttg2D family ABC transporter substrate-binding protein [Alphaproteobacteria bacterium]